MKQLIARQFNRFRRAGAIGPAGRHAGVNAHYAATVRARAMQLLHVCILCAACAAAATHVAAATSLNADRTVLIPDAIVTPDGELTPDMAIVIEDGRIVAIEAASTFEAGDESDGVTVLHRPGTIISPGLIDLGSGLGVHGDRTARYDPIDPDIRVVDGLNPADASLRTSLQHGVTAALLVPASNNLIGGAAAVIRTYAPDTGEAEVVRDAGPLVVSLGSPVLQLNRAPTSRAGALSMLRNTFAAARDGRGNATVAEALDGERDVLVIAERGEDITSAYRLFETYGLAPIVMHRGDMLEVVDDIVEADAPVIVGPYSFGSPITHLLEAGRLAERGVVVGFASGLPAAERDALRMTAALAVRYGMNAAAARRGLTATAAQIAGVADRMGTLQPGRAADMVVFSADPLQLNARVLEVYVDGRRVWSAQHALSDAWPDEHDFETEIETPDAGDTDHDDEGE